MVWHSLYIHIPFCMHRCGYCDFNTYAGLEKLIPQYTQALVEELEFVAQSAPERVPIHTVYFGGGTPSLLSENELEMILATISKSFQLSPAAEISLEANPGTVSKDYLKNIHQLGINRISLGMQSADSDELFLLERQHTFMDVLNAVEWIRMAGITNLNLDLIYGLPSQKIETWLASIQAAITLQPEHLSMYALTLEPSTPMQHKIERGFLSQLNSDQAADMYEAASERLVQAGFVQYEISNWAKENNSGELFACQHNLQYWRNLPYFGLGAGAHGYVNCQRTVDVAKPGIYIKRITTSDIRNNAIKFPSTPATVHSTMIDYETEVGETMMMGLRLVIEGVSSAEFKKRFGMNMRELFGAQIEHLIAVGLLEWAGEPQEVLRLTKNGYLLGNQVFKEFI